jgi:hypothetical protein
LYWQQRERVPQPHAPSHTGDEIMNKYLLIPLIIVLLLATAAIALPADREWRPLSGQYSILTKYHPDGLCDVLLVNKQKSTTDVMLYDCCNINVHWSPDYQHFLMWVRLGSNASQIAIFRTGTDRPQLIDCIYQPDDRGIVEPMFTLFNYKPKNRNLFDKALEGLPRDVGYRHYYCDFVKWTDSKHAVLNIRMHDPADKYYRTKNKKVLAGIDREYVYQIKQ